MSRIQARSSALRGPGTGTGTGPKAVLGQLLGSQEPIYQAFQDAYCKKRSKNRRGMTIKSSFDLIKIPEQGFSEEINRLFPAFHKNVAAVIDLAVELDGSLSVPVRDLLMSPPTDLPCIQVVETFIIPDDDQREGLRGQQGLRVRPDAPRGIKAGEFIGFYSGLSFLTDRKYSRFSGSESAVAAAKAAVAAGAPAAAIDSSNIDLKTLETIAMSAYIAGAKAEIGLETYAANTSTFSFAATAAQLEVKLPRGVTLNPDEQLVVTASDHGNLTARINDPHLDPLVALDEATALKDNVCVCEVVVGAWPWLVMFAFRDIAPGQELLYSYGKGFWDLLRTRHNVVAGAEEKLREMRDNASLGGHTEDMAAANAAAAVNAPEAEQEDAPSAQKDPYMSASAPVHHYGDEIWPGDLDQVDSSPAGDGNDGGEGSGDGEACEEPVEDEVVADGGEDATEADSGEDPAESWPSGASAPPRIGAQVPVGADAETQRNVLGKRAAESMLEEENAKPSKSPKTPADLRRGSGREVPERLQKPEPEVIDLTMLDD